jgi:hypothetical protein
MLKKILAISVATVGLMLTVSIPSAQAKPNAMTWTVLDAPLVLGGKTYVLFGSDAARPGGITNPYQGDTSINEYRSLLCIKKNPLLPAPLGLPPSAVTPGGSTTYSWSGGSVFIIPNVQGTQLTSLAVANNICSSFLTIGSSNGTIGTIGNIGRIGRIGNNGYRMAEFHDGTGINPGWSYWAELKGPITLGERYWVYINDQPAANPW